MHLFLLICDGFCAFDVGAFLAVALLLVDGISYADGKDTASVRHHLYKYNDGPTRWELQRLIIGYFNDRRDRGWRPCQVVKENKLTWEVFCLALGLDLQSMVEKSRATVWATRVDDVLDMLCPSQKDSRRPHDLHAGSSDRADLLDDPEEKETGPTARADLSRCIHSSPTVCDSMTSWRGCLTKVF